MDFHRLTHTLCAAIAAACAVYVASEIHAVRVSNQGNLNSATYNLRTLSYNLAAASDNVASITGSIRDPQSGLPALMASLNGKHGVKQLLYNADILTAQVGRTSNTVRLASLAEQDELKQASVLAVDSLKKFNVLIADTNQSINAKDGGVLPAITGDLTALNGTIESLTLDTKGMFASATDAMSAAGKLLSDPSIPAATKSFADASIHVNSATAHLDAALGYVEDDLKPQHISFWKTLASQVVSQAIGIPLKWLPARVNVVSSVPIPVKPQQ